MSTKIELPISKNHIDLLIDIFRKKRVNCVVSTLK